MKYQSIQGFEKHLKDTPPGHLSRAYLILMPSVAEQKKIIADISSLIKKEKKTLSLVRFKAGEDAMEKVGEQLMSRDLFSQETLIVVEEAEKLRKEEQALVASLFPFLAPFSFIILSGISMTQLTDFYHKGKKELLVLDLSEEKPWEKQKRITEWVYKEVKKEGKAITPQALTLLVEAVGLDFALLSQEIAKLLCYIGERATIEPADIAALSPKLKVAAVKDLIEALLWEKGKCSYALDPSQFFLFLSQVHYQLEMGYQLAVSKEKAAVKPYQIEKYLAPALKRGERFFKEALNSLFEIELLAKNSSLEPNLLLNMFIAKLSLS